MNKVTLTVAILIISSASLSYAEETSVTMPATTPVTVAAPDNVVSYNLGVVSDYRFRGISQTRLQPAVQGGADYANTPTGLYVGTWLSTLKWIDDAGGNGNVEWDMYAGKKGNITENWSYDLGVLTYVYPSNDLHANADTTELYGQIGYGPAYLKYSQAVTNLFGFANSKNSGYVDLGANIDVTNGYVINLHVGHQTVKNNSASSYSDWKIGVTKDFGFLSGSVALIGTDTKNYSGPGPDRKDLGKTALLLSAIKTF